MQFVANSVQSVYGLSLKNEKSKTNSGIDVGQEHLQTIKYNRRHGRGHGYRYLSTYFISSVPFTTLNILVRN